MAKHAALFIAGLLVMKASGQSVDPDNPVTAQDRIELVEIQARTEEYCSGSFAGREDLEDERVEARQNLVDGVGGENWILNILVNAEVGEDGTADIGGSAEEELSDPAFIIRQAAPLLMMVITLVVYSCCCWSACCCCWRGKCCHKICRCPGRCAKKRSTNIIVKVVGLLVVVLIVALTGVSALLAMRGYGKIQDGFDNFACTSASLTSDVLGGNTVTGFIGIVPLLDKYSNLTDQLNDGSDMVTDVFRIIDSTVAIDTSLELAAATLQLMRDTLALPENVVPKGTNTQQLFHTCTLCQELPAILDPVITALSEGAGAALRDARAEVRDQLSPAARADLRFNLDSTSEPLREVKAALFASLGALTGKDSPMIQLKNNMGAEAGLGMTMGIFIALACTVCGCMASGCFVVKEEAGEGRPNPCIHRTSCCAWFCTLPCTALLFFTGGLLLLISSPLSGICLIMDDLDSTLLRDIAPAMDLNTDAGDSFDMTMDILDQCFAVQNPLEAANLMDILFVTENGERKYVRQILVDDVTSQITGQFDQVSESMAGDGNTLANSQEVLDLIDLLQNNPVSTMMVPSFDQGQDLAQGYPLLATAGGDLSTAFASSVSCNANDHMPDAALGDDSQQGIPSLGGLISNVASTCSCNLNGGACPTPPVACNPDPAASAECSDAERFLILKQRVVNEAQYRCDLFQQPGNSLQYCDVRDMSSTPSGNERTYSNDCMSSGGLPTVKEQTCTLAEFNTYIQEFGTRISNVLTRVDNTVAEVGTTINVDLRTLTETYVTTPMQEIVDQATCGFLTEAYRNMVGGLCYQGVRGMLMVGQGYTMAAAMGLIFAAVMYAYWRRSVDNWNAYYEAIEAK